MAYLNAPLNPKFLVTVVTVAFNIFLLVFVRSNFRSLINFSVMHLWMRQKSLSPFVFVSIRVRACECSENSCDTGPVVGIR